MRKIRSIIKKDVVCIRDCENCDLVMRCLEDSMSYILNTEERQEKKRWDLSIKFFGEIRLN